MLSEAFSAVAQSVEQTQSSSWALHARLARRRKQVVPAECKVACQYLASVTVKGIVQRTATVAQHHPIQGGEGGREVSWTLHHCDSQHC